VSVNELIPRVTVV